MDGVAARIAQQRPRVHILTGTVCNNNCIFCMEEDREGRKVTNAATTDESVRWISMMTNGRALSHEPYTRALLAAGLNRLYVSIHGHTQKLHEGLTRTPDSFAQTLAGIDVAARYKRFGLVLHTSTVVTRRNLPHLADIYALLRAHGVDQVVFNVMQANGRANTYFDQLFPRYTEIAAAAEAFLQSQRERPVQAYFVDIPLCTTTRLPDHNRGYVEDYTHFEPPNPGHDIVADLESRRAGEHGELVQIRRADLDDSARRKRPACASCRHDRVCEGVWGNDLRRHGWDEFVPVA